MALKSENSQLLSKLAISDQHGENSLYFDGWRAYREDPFHALENPNGVIQMGLAENQLCFDLIEEWIREHPTASICTSEGVNMFLDIAIFQDYHGLTEFRKAVAGFMGKVRGGRVTFDPDRVVMAGGATGASETVMFCLADRGDAFLVPTPYYPAFDRDLKWRTGVQLIPVNCMSSNDFQIPRQALEEAYKKSIEANIRVKGVIVANPSNPLGTTMDRETLKSVVSFINEKNIHLVCDEIYSATIFGNPNFVSVSEIIEEVECNRDLIHIIYSLSKDMGLPGFRIGILYSYNDVVMNIGRKMSSFGLVSSQTQHLLASMLSDDEFVDKFLATSSNRLANRHKIFTNGLEEVGINCLKSNAGLFCWMDLRPLLKESTFEAEMLLWKEIVNDVKLNVSPGHSFHCVEPGWFRVCFANMDEETLHVALDRIRKFVAQETENDQPATNKEQQWKKKPRLSFSSSRLCDDSLKSPSTRSPHTPLSPSQLSQTRT